MAECYGSWLCDEAVREETRRERIENAKMRIEDELYEALDGDLHDFYDILINANGSTPETPTVTTLNLIRSK